MAIDINIPSQVKTYANLAGFPATGSLKTIFIAEDTNKTYRWTGTAYVEVSAAGASGITIGTTAITSGTVGRVLFEGTGNVVQESANLFWDNTNGRLGIGTSSPAKTLSVVGSATSGFDAITFKGQYSETGYLATSNGAIYLASGAGVTGSFLELSSGVANLRGGTTAVTFTVASERMRINNAGNVLINTTTDAGFKLDVNGTARVVTSSGSYTAPLTVENTGSASDAFKNVAFFAGNRGNASSIDDNTNIGIQQKSNIINNFATLNFFNAGGNLSAYIGAQFLSHSGGQNGNLVFGTTTNGTPSTKMTIFSTGNVSINTTTDSGYKLDVNGTARVQGNFNQSGLFFGMSVTGYWTINNTGNSTGFGSYISQQGMSYSSSQPFCFNVASGAHATSASVQIDSTTKGFLPPRMTTTQKNAIASPAAGLMVYDTTLNVISYYNGSMWI